jgi:MYXO-CTERM domain-containing protein
VCADQNGTGVCVDACSQNANCPAPGSVPQCPAGGGTVCNGKTGQCVPNDCTAFPDCCSTNQNCVVDANTGVGQCVTNLCAGVTCPSDQYCEQGNCVGSCASVTCPSGQRCRLGACETDPCGHPCPFGQVCNDTTGACIVDPCQFRNCPQGQWCNPNDGQCEADPCVGTMCPADPPGQICRGGTCYDPSAFQGDGGEQHVTVAGGGCSTGDGAGAGLILVLGAMLMRRRRTTGGAL